MKNRKGIVPVAGVEQQLHEKLKVIEATWSDVQLEDPLGMEVGYRLIPMVDHQQDGELPGRIRSIRKKFAQ